MPMPAAIATFFAPLKASDAAIRNSGLRGREIWLSIFICGAAGAFYSFWNGLDANWDLRNYHYYAVYAFFNNRYDIDIAPGQMQTWFSPFVEFSNYFIIRYLDPYIGTLIIGFISGLNAAAVYALARLAISEKIPATYARLIASITAIAAFVSPMFLSEAGTTMTDANTGLLILVALIVVWKFDFSTRSLFASGLLIGMAVGFKLTNVIFAVAFIVAVAASRRQPIFKTMPAVCFALALGYLPIGGFWNIFLWVKYKNPMFPLFNDVFHAPATLAQAWTDERFKPKSLAQVMSLPSKWAIRQASTSEIPFRDVRFMVIGMLSIFLWPAIFANSERQRRDFVFRKDVMIFIGVFSFAALLVWLKLFAIQRYIVILEQLSFLLLISLLDRIVLQAVPKALTFLVAFAFVMTTTVAPDWAHMPMGHRWLEADFPADQKDREILHVMLSGEALSYVIVSAPASHVFIRIEGNFPVPLNTGLGQLALERIAHFKGEIRSLSLAKPSSDENVLLKNYGLELAPGDCEVITTRVETLQSCPLTRL